MHVGLNLVFLTPGETGGMEIYARELIAALVAAPVWFTGGVPVGLSRLSLPRGEAGGREPSARGLLGALVGERRPELRLTAFVTRGAAAPEGRGNGLIPAVTVPVDARRRI